MFNTNHSTPLSSPTLSSPSQPLGAGPTLGSAPFLPSPTAAAPPLHATYLAPAPLAAPGATDMDMLIDQPSAAAVDDVMMTDDRIVADDDPMTGGGAESDSEMMIDDHDIGGPGAATPMSVSMGGESADVDVEMVASEMTYNVAGGVVGVPVAEHLLQQQQQQFAFEAQCVQLQPGFAAAPAQLAQEVYFMQDAALSGGPQEQKPAQEQEQLVLPSDLPPTSVVEEDLLDYVEEQLVEELELEQVGGQVESAVTEPQAVSVADPSVPTLVDVAAPYTIEPEAPLSATAQSSPHSHPHDPEADDSQDHADADEYYDDADAYYDEDHDGEMPHITLTYNGVTYAVFPPLAVAEQEDAAVTTSSSSPSSPSYPPLFPSADESELGSIRDGTINDFMWRVKERFELGEDMDVALKYMNLDGIMIREETAIGYDNQFDSFWSLYMALYPGATDPLHIEVVAELSAAAKLDMLLYRAQYADESEACVESTSSSPSPQLPVDAGAVVDESKPVAVETPGLPQRQVELAAALQGVAGKLDDGAGQDEQHVEEVAEEGVEVAERDLDFQEPVPNQAQEPETDTHQQQPQLQQEQAIGTQQDHKYVDDYPADFEGAQHQAVVPTEEATNDDVAHVDGVQEHFGDEHHTTDSSAQGQQPTAEAGVLESELSQAPELNLANPDTYEPAVSEPASIAAPEQQPQPSVHQHLTSEEFLDWVEDEAVNEPVPEHGLIDNSAGDDTPVPPVSLNDHDSSASSSSPIVVLGQSSSYAAPSTGIPPSPAPTVDPLVPAPSSAPASRPSSPVADSAAGMVGDPLVAGGTTAPAATNGAMKRSLEVMDTNDFDPCDEPKTNTPYKRQRTSDERN